MKRALLFLTLVAAVAALPQVAKSQDAAAIQDRLRWISSFAMSGALYHSHMQALGLDMKVDSLGPYQPPDLGPLISTSYVATHDSPNQDVEPTISNVLMGYTPYITSAYMTYSSVAPNLPLIHSVTTTDSFTTFTPSSPFLMPPTVPPHGSFQQAYDPFLASSPSNGHLYTVGVANTYPPSVTAVCVWASTNGGSVWSAPTAIENNSADTTYELDKPHIAVNPNNGYVFVTYLQYTPYQPPAPLGEANIHLARSTDGGAHFTLLNAPQGSSGVVGGPQLAVNPTNSNLYLVWADYGTNSLRVSTSTDNGNSWGTPVNLSIPTGHLIGPVAGLRCDIPNQLPNYFYPCLSNYIRIYSLPIVRYNPVASVLGVTWHQREDNGTTNPVPTDTYYSTFNGSTWLAPVVVSATAGVNEFMPALDSDDDGNVSITYYSTSGITGNAKYREWLAFRISNGTVIRTNRLLASLPSDPHNYTIWPYFIGDYQDGTSIRDMGYRRYVPAWVGIDAGFNPPRGEIHFTDDSY